jgi:hypothetical protein
MCQPNPIIAAVLLMVLLWRAAELQRRMKQRASPWR